MRLLLSLMAAAATLAVAQPVAANPIVAPGVGAPPPQAQFVLGPASADVGQNIRGYLGPDSFDPLGGYPPAVPNPPAGFVPADGGALLFSGTIAATGQAGDISFFYCVDLLTSTYAGLGYDVGSWSAAAVTNMGYINRIISTHYPSTTLPAGAVSDDQRAAAVQAAIWFFSDKFVMSTSGLVNAALYPIVSGIVAATLAAGPLTTEPPLPAITVTGPDTFDAGTIAGPFSLQSNATEATLTVTGAQVFLDAAGTQPLPTPATLAVGTPFYLLSEQPGEVTVAASAIATALPGVNALYHAANPDNPQPSTAQKLVLAEDAPIAVSTTRTFTAVTPAPVEPAEPAAPVLAATGNTTALFAGLAVMLVLAGIGLRRFSRRRSA